MEIKGKVISKLEIEKGTSKAGNEWEKQTFVIATFDDQYPKQVAFEGFGKIVEFSNKLKKNDEVTVQFNPESQEWKGKWYTKLSAWKVEVNNSAGAKQEPDLPKGEDSNTLPF